MHVQDNQEGGKTFHQSKDEDKAAGKKGLGGIRGGRDNTREDPVPASLKEGYGSWNFKKFRGGENQRVGVGGGGGRYIVVPIDSPEECLASAGLRRKNNEGVDSS